MTEADLDRVEEAFAAAVERCKKIGCVYRVTSFRIYCLIVRTLFRRLH